MANQGARIISDSRLLSQQNGTVPDSKPRNRLTFASSPSPEEIESLLQLMSHEMGPSGWWPADTTFEIMVGAVLIQNTILDNVQRSLIRLKEADALAPDAIATMKDFDLQELIHPSGFYRNKSRALQSLAQWYRERFDCEPANAQNIPDDELRRELLGLFGIGGETADVLLLYVFSRRAFVADTYARRLFTFLGCSVPPTYPAFHSKYEPIMLATRLTSPELQELHALIDEFGKAYRDENAKAKSFLAAMMTISRA